MTNESHNGGGGGSSDKHPKPQGQSSRRRSRRRRKGGQDEQKTKDRPDQAKGEARTDRPANERDRPSSRQGGQAKQDQKPDGPGSNEGRSSRSRRRRRPRGSSGGQGGSGSQGGERQDRSAKRQRRGGQRRGGGGGQQHAEAQKRAEPVEEHPPRKVEPFFLVPAADDPRRLAKDEPVHDWVDGELLYNIVAVRFNQGGMIEEFDASDQVYDRGDQLIVETEKGLQLGEVIIESRREMRTINRLPRVIRSMNPNDSRQERRNQSKEEQAFKICQRLAGQFKLPMKLIGVDYLHGGNRAIFYFSAEGRIDFRQLVRELASQLHTRIEMRQVGVRDASRHVGGVGPCGQQLCCNAFLQRFAPVSIRMAKDQNLVLNPQKVSGVCGRLMCCLTYEQKGYEALRKGLPRTGKKVHLANGKAGKVRDVDVLRRKFRVQLDEGGFEVVSVDELRAQPTSTPEHDRAVDQRNKGNIR